ncbi:cadherin-like domain-containing protein [Tardiphaga sp. 709]|uniref:cadherin-like domain-containing protein n=1 Tax=Tardiphaga sp. 709 TaxID=3076039 RepID=UPI0028E343A8|nr:cadherin-like domain-containing protein [Tardiphaga sp. 709]WNV12814.1 cadherin-like domain-containing protein [Tardiphaga sp. 709]
MDERLSLGIPDRSAIDAPARRFALIAERSRVSSIVPAMLVATWGLLLKQVIGGDDDAASRAKPTPPVPETAASEPETTGSVGTSPQRSPGSSELMRAFGFTSGSMNERNLTAVDLDGLAFARTEGPRLSLIPANQNVPAAPRESYGAAEPKPASGSGSGGGGGGGDRHDPTVHGETPHDDAKLPPDGKLIDPPKRNNHAPVFSGSVDLGRGLVNEAIVISMSQLLIGASDPDGDALSVQALTVDHGSLQVLGPDRWLYTPEHDETGPVQFGYRISDGTASIIQTAHANLHLARVEDIQGTDGNDFLIGTPHADTIDAGAGDDIAYGREDADTIYGGEGNDRIVGGDGDDVLIGGSGNDVIFGGAGNDILFGGAGNDVLYGEDGNDMILADDGDDFASGGAGNDVIFGGAGNDTLQGDAGNDTIDGEEGNDHIDGGAGSDRLLGGEGNDTIAGGAGDDTVVGGAGNDCIQGGEGDDHIDGGSGNDALSGDAGDDAIQGLEGDDHIDGGAGNDIIAGGAGDDTIDAGSGDDVVIVTSEGGHDIVIGGSGNDTLDLSDIVFDEDVDLPDGVVVLCNGQTAQIFEIENVRGGHGRDRLVADVHVNIMEGGDGDDTFVFRDVGSLKNDGGPRDHILDFSVGDKLDLSRVGQPDDFAGKKLFFAGAGEANFEEVGAVTYHHEIVSDDQQITVVTGNLDGTQEHEFEIVLDGNIDLTEANFVLATNAQHNQHA